MEDETPTIVESGHTAPSGESSKAKGKGRDVGDINYDSEQFEWSDPLVMKLKTVFGFDSFRVCQEG